MRLGDVMWKQVIELRSRNHASPRDDERLEALFRWVLPYYYGWNTRHTHSPDLRYYGANSPNMILHITILGDMPGG